ncbi:GNAT family N-acetyltransferase [Acidiphilium sp.]|uniref:GNAT family N-acetyltransferase n=1 Tax=Acidiphilium sp. TaxID=527 RepID=UPI003D029E13
MAQPHKRWPVAPGLVAHLRPAPDAETLGTLWRGLEAVAEASVFQSWLWLGCRFDSRFDRAIILTIEATGRVLAIGLLNRARHWFLPLAALSETGDPAEDSVFIEHNGPLVARDHPEIRPLWFAAALTARSPLGALLRVSGISDDDRAAVQRHGVTDLGITRPAPWRDLAALRASNTDCLSAVSANTRQQINRARRRSMAAGPITLTRADTVALAQSWLAALAALHQATWQARGKPGAFANPAFQRFHTELVARGVTSGAVDLLQITAGPQVIGYLYNFVWRGTVSAYQSGFAYQNAHPHEKPGLVCHVAAMRHYQAAGLDRYDFLAGGDRYKTSLADQTVTLHWLLAAPRLTLAAAALAARTTLAARRRPIARPAGAIMPTTPDGVHRPD